MKKAQIYRRTSGRLKHFTQEEVTLFLREAGRPKYHKRQSSKLDLLFGLMYYLGLREIEAVRIKLADFHKSPTGDMLAIKGLKDGLEMTYPLPDPSPFTKKIKAWLFNAKLREWEDFYNYNRPHAALGGQTHVNDFGRKSASQCNRSWSFPQ